MNKSKQTWKQAFAEVNTMHRQALKKQEEILMNKIFNKEGSNLFLKYIAFEHNGTWITDHTLDETGRFEVNSVEYYKEDYIKALENLL
ncbi:MAG TPA: hypothetical protein EYQ00_12005 [Dehalococcoidia bacterium]|nr:hypothetical protein [Dehalococcoidia bacterium]